MGGNWEAMTLPEELTLSLVSRIRVIALGVLASQGVIDTAIFTADLNRGENNVSEASVHHVYFRSYFPQCANVRCIEEDLGRTTKADAAFTADIIESEGLKWPFTLITSRAFLRRQTAVYEREGIDVITVAAEPILASHSPADAAFVQDIIELQGDLNQ